MRSEAERGRQVGEVRKGKLETQTCTNRNNAWAENQQPAALATGHNRDRMCQCRRVRARAAGPALQSKSESTQAVLSGIPALLATAGPGRRTQLELVRGRKRIEREGAAIWCCHAAVNVIMIQVSSDSDVCCRVMSTAGPTGVTVTSDRDG